MVTTQTHLPSSIVTHICNTSTGMTAEESGVQGHPQLYNKSEPSLDYMRLSLQILKHICQFNYITSEQCFPFYFCSTKSKTKTDSCPLLIMSVLQHETNLDHECHSRIKKILKLMPAIIPHSIVL